MCCSIRNINTTPCPLPPPPLEGPLELLKIGLFKFPPRGDRKIFKSLYPKTNVVMFGLKHCKVCGDPLFSLTRATFPLLNSFLDQEPQVQTAAQKNGFNLILGSNFFTPPECQMSCDSPNHSHGGVGVLGFN